MFRNRFMAPFVSLLMRCPCTEPYEGILCKACFKVAMLKKIRQNLGKVHKDETLQASDFASQVLADVLNGLPFRRGMGREVVEWTADDELAAFLESLFQGRQTLLDRSAQCLKIFSNLTDEETRKLASCYGIEWHPHPKPASYAHISVLSKKYPELKNALRK